MSLSLKSNVFICNNPVLMTAVCYAHLWLSLAWLTGHLIDLTHSRFLLAVSPRALPDGPDQVAAAAAVGGVPLPGVHRRAITRPQRRGQRGTIYMPWLIIEEISYEFVIRKQLTKQDVSPLSWLLKYTLLRKIRHRKYVDFMLLCIVNVLYKMWMIEVLKYLN